MEQMNTEQKDQTIGPAHQVRYKQRTRHGLHVVLTVMTAGLWAFTGWPAVALWNWMRSGKKTYTVEPGDPRG